MRCQINYYYIDNKNIAIVINLFLKDTVKDIIKINAIISKYVNK